MMLRPTLSLLALAAGLLALPAQAEEPRYNQVGLRAEVSREVPHDRMHVTLYREEQHGDPAVLAGRITEALNRAVARSRTVRAVSASLGSRHSYPVYEDKGRKIIGWRERAELRLESADFAALARLAGELQEELQMADMSFSLSEASRKRHEDELLREAVQAFQARARLLSEALGASRYQLVRLDLNSTGFARPPLLRAMAMKDSAMAAGAPAAEIEAGNSELRISADGVIEVQPAP